MGQSARETRKNRWTYFLLGLFMIVGLGLILYPTVADFWNKNFTSRAVNEYATSVANLSNEEYERLLKAALSYNEKLATNASTVYPEAEIPAYEEALSTDDRGIMGVIEIKKINISFPIYHGTADSVLSQAIGHLEWTSLPVGAASWDEEKGIVTNKSDGCHTVISGHRGLPSARLFTDIDQLETGDIFALKTMDEILTYEVDQILTIEPSDLDNLKIVPGMDYCTLLTCTPYGVNSHRLLIRGHRVPTNTAYWFTYHIQANSVQIRPLVVTLIIVAPVLAILFLTALISPGRKRRKLKIDEEIMEELEVAELPLYRLDLSVMAIQRLMGRRQYTDERKARERKNTQNH